MRNIKVIFLPADKELAEKLCRIHEKLADRYLALRFIFIIIAGIDLGGMFYFITCITAEKTYYDVTVWITFISAIILILASSAFETEYDYHSANALHYQFMAKYMQEISEHKDSLTFSVSRTCSNTVTYGLPDGRRHDIETVNNIPADGDVIITIKENSDAKGQISLDWYAKTV